MSKKSKIIGLSVLGAMAVVATASVIPIVASCAPSSYTPSSDDESSNVNITYQPSEQTKLLLSNHSLNNMKNNLNRYTKIYNDYFKANINPYKEIGINNYFYKLCKLDLIGNKLKIEILNQLDYIPGFEFSPEHHVPWGNNISDLYFYNYDIDLELNTYTYSCNRYYIVDNKQVDAPPYLDKPIIKIYNANIIKILIDFLVYTGDYLNLHGVLDPFIHISSLPIEKQNKIYKIVDNLIQIIPPNNNIIKFCQLYDVKIEQANDKISMFRFEFAFVDLIDPNSGRRYIKYIFKYDNTSNSWILEYYFNVCWKSNKVTKTITGITDQQLTNFFAEILNNNKIIDVEQIKK